MKGYVYNIRLNVMVCSNDRVRYHGMLVRQGKMPWYVYNIRSNVMVCF